MFPQALALTRSVYGTTCWRRESCTYLHHSYFNLKDGGASDILGHELMIKVSKFTPVDKRLIPWGAEARCWHPPSISKRADCDRSSRRGRQQKVEV